MLAAAYLVADGSPIEVSPELLLLREISRWGVQSVMGRPLYYHEIQHLRAAERVILAYKSKHESEDWARWAQDHKAEDYYLNEAMKLARKYAG